MTDKNIYFRFSIVTSLLFALCLIAACSKPVDTSDPEAVAREFWTAIQNKDIETATDNIYMPVRKQLSIMIKKDFKSNMLPITPENLEFEMRLDGDRAIAKILNTDGVGIDLIKADGRWWVN